ncbi:fructose-1,6-bisphosphate aldolase/phosphatase [Nocardioides mesophilus]|uniref:Fructose-1,6-bisphosphate aldolase/phosphatase n=1 Tax=Nocardioides mesophilus TaxID=433659 RepID=A0A7G9RD04_9ACTN|nr:fructose-1,6-bisphosphate aldolase/phosphatase [Nocardioides mesophilus]QNN53479.1 fructose 1,6-bisphosphatase [Nocardioides mesophilus]
MATLSIIKADTGGWVGHSAVHPEQLATAKVRAEEAVSEGLLMDAHVASCGDDLALVMSHRLGPDHPDVHGFAYRVFQETTAVAQRLGLYGAGQDLLSDAFSGNLRGMGPGYAELELEERPSEPVLCFLADKTEPGAWNLPLYKMFADPFNTAGLVIDSKMHAGFVFEVFDLYEEKRIEFRCSEESYDLLMYIGAPARYVIHSVTSRALGITAAATSTQRLSLIAGKYVGKDDPVMIVRAQSGLPAVGEILEPFTLAHTVAGCMRGSHHAPLMPVAADQAHPSRFDGPPRVVALGFQLHEGMLGMPRDLFADPSFDTARSTANTVMDYLRRHGPFEPHRLPLEDLEYTTMHDLEAVLARRWQPIPGAKKAAGV